MKKKSNKEEAKYYAFLTIPQLKLRSEVAQIIENPSPLISFSIGTKRLNFKLIRRSSSIIDVHDGNFDDGLFCEYELITIE